MTGSGCSPKSFDPSPRSKNSDSEQMPYDGEIGRDDATVDDGDDGTGADCHFRPVSSPDCPH